MGIRGDVLDLTDLQRRGILKKEQETQQSSVKVDRGGYFDMSSPEKSENPVQSDLPNPMGFLDSLASTNPSTDAVSSSSGVDSLELQGLKSKIDDLEYKLDRLMEKIAKMESE
jgi:hypothetical protein